MSVVPTHDTQRGFYSTYFLVPRKTGDYRPILDLHILSQCIAHKKFQTLTIQRLLKPVQPGDWFTTDLKSEGIHTFTKCLELIWMTSLRQERLIICFMQQLFHVV